MFPSGSKNSQISKTRRRKRKSVAAGLLGYSDLSTQGQLRESIGERNFFYIDFQQKRRETGAHFLLGSRGTWM